MLGTPRQKAQKRGDSSRLIRSRLNRRFVILRESSLLDRRVVVFHLTKWHRLAAGNVRDASRTWWPRAFVSEPAFQDLEGGDMVHPPHEYYNLKGKAGEI